MFPLESSCPWIKASTSSSLILSPRDVNMCRSSALDMKPFPSWKYPSAILYKSGQLGENHFKITYNVSYEIPNAIPNTLSKCLKPSTKSSAVSVIFFEDTACKIGRNVSKDTRSEAFCVCTRRFTSASVGFCPKARRTSPTWFAYKESHGIKAHRNIFALSAAKIPLIQISSLVNVICTYRDHTISFCIKKHKCFLKFTDKILTKRWFSRHIYGTEIKLISYD